MSSCLARGKGAVQSCEEKGETCLFALRDSVWQVDASIGGNVTHIQDLKQDVTNALSQLGKRLHDSLTREISLQRIPDVVAFCGKLNQLQIFLQKAQYANISSQLLQDMKLVEGHAKSKMNLTDPIDQMLDSITSLEESEEVNSDLKYVSLALTQAQQVVQHQDYADLSEAYHDGAKHLCARLQEFAAKLETIQPVVVFLYMAVVDQFKPHLEKCRLNDAILAGKKTLDASLQSAKGLRDLSKALERQKSWFGMFSSIWGGKNHGSTLLRSVESYLDAGLVDRRKELEASDPDLVAVFENFEPLRREMLILN